MYPMKNKLDNPRRSTIGPLKLWRISKGLTQQQVATILGFAYQHTYGEIERGLVLMRERKLRELDKLTDLPGLMAAYVIWYFDFTDDQVRTVLMSQATSGVVLV